MATDGTLDLTLASGVLFVILFAYLTTWMIGLRIAGSEILSRTAPTLLDLGVAMVAGAAAAFASTRRSIRSSIAGVAIAVALVPPLAVTGIGLALGRKATTEGGLSLTEFGLYSGGDDIASGAFILFLANLAGIIVVAGAVLLSQGYGHWQKAVLAPLVIATVSALLLEPLGESLRRLYAKNRATRVLTKLMAARPDIFSTEGRIESLHVTQRAGLLHVNIEGVTTRESMMDMPEKLEIFRKALSADLGEAVSVEVEVIPVEFFRYVSTPRGKAQPG